MIEQERIGQTAAELMETLEERELTECDLRAVMIVVELDTGDSTIYLAPHLAKLECSRSWPGCTGHGSVDGGGTDRVIMYPADR